MPIYIETTALDSDDQQDLAKIYHDYFELSQIEALLESAKSTSLTNAGEANKQEQGGFRVARFNSRLLGALFLEKQDDGMIVKHLCVRDITRNRGVATRLLTVLKEEFGEQLKLGAISADCDESHRSAIEHLAENLSLEFV